MSKDAPTIAPPLPEQPLKLRGRVLETGWDVPADLSEAEWCEAGKILGRLERSVTWCIGDWWAFGEAHYGDRKAVVEADDWEGPSFQTCMNAAAVCRAFKETSRRREVLSFTHHAEVAGRAAKEADRLLDWAQETVGETGKPRTVAALRSAVRASVRSDKKQDYNNRIEAANPKALQGTYRILYADPPWKYIGLNQADEYGHAERHYDCLDDNQLCDYRPGDGTRTVKELNHCASHSPARGLL
jgi:hypothetical protein